MIRLILAAVFAISIVPACAREIAITFDDAPTADSALMTGEARTERLLAALSAAGISEAAFFAVPKHRSHAELGRLGKYVRAGHVIANHSNQHQNLRNLSPETYLADIAAADAILRRLPGFRPWFRFPFLAEGETREKRDAVRAGLRAMGYTQGYVTIDNYDWYLNTLANKAAREAKTVDQNALRDLYIETLISAVEFYDTIAVKVLGRSPRHVLLLHENDLAALFVADLAAALRARGWTIVPAATAYQDPIAAIEPDTLFLNQGRVAAIAHTQGMKPIDLVHDREDEAVLDRLFVERALQHAN